MNAPASVEALEIARLKRAFGAALEPGEEALLASAPEGRGATPEWLKACLASWNPEPDEPDPDGERRAAGPPELIARFEASQQAGARLFLRRFPRFVAIVAAISGVPCPVIVYLKTGGFPPRALFEVFTLMYVWMGAFCLACWLRARRILRENDLVRFVSAHESGRHITPRMRALLWVSLALLVALQARHSGWTVAVLGMGGLLVVMRIGTRLLRGTERRHRLQEDRELWAWWYGEEASGSGSGETRAND